MRKARLKPRTNYPHHKSRISRNVVKHLPRFYHCLYSTRPRNYHCLQSVATSSTFSIIHRLYTTINSPKSPPLSASDITLSFGTHTTPRPRFHFRWNSNHTPSRQRHHSRSCLPTSHRPRQICQVERQSRTSTKAI